MNHSAQGCPAPRRRNLKRVLTVGVIFSFNACSSNAPENTDPNFVDSAVAGRNMARVELKQCKPSTEVGPTLKRGRMPRYPVAHYYNNKPGEVDVRFDVTESGDTDNVEVLRSTSESFIVSVGAAIERWKFKPATNGGEPVRVTCTQRHGFSVE